VLCRAEGLPLPVPEYRFDTVRRFRFDYAWPLRMVAAEIDGGVWTGGRHTRGKGFIEDQRKTNLAAKLGWFVLRYTPDRLEECLADLRIMFAEESV
jgi:very-short-patch-repair endonuclease